jgi:serine protease Do
MQESHTSLAQELARARRKQHRATLLAVAACALAVGVLLGVALSARRATVTATNPEANVEMSSAFVDIARRVEPAVVNISVVIQPHQRGGNEFPANDRPRLDDYGRGRALRGNGSGVVVDSAGYILTNQHVIRDADRIVVKFFDGQELAGRVIGSDLETDLAVVKVEPTKPLPAARIGDSERIRVGEWVLAIGSPFNLSQTVTAGIISAKDRESVELNKRSGRGFQYFLQTDAAINPGNSGGPLINLTGEVIGINTAIATSTGDYNGVGFALPSREALHVYTQLAKAGVVTRGFLGVTTDPVTAQIANIYQLPASRGALVSNINDMVAINGTMVASPAAQAGLKLNDVILSFRGELIRDDKDLMRRIGSTPVGTVAPLRVWRNNAELTLNVTVARRPGTELPPAALAANGFVPNALTTPRASAPAGVTSSAGIGFAELSGQLGVSKMLYQIAGVYVAQVAPGSVADDAGLRAGDVIEALNRKTVLTRDEFKRALALVGSGQSVVLQVYRPGTEPTPRMFISFDKP